MASEGGFPVDGISGVFRMAPRPAEGHQAELARVCLLQPRTGTFVWRPGPGRTAGLAQLRSDGRHARWRGIPFVGGAGPAVAVAKILLGSFVCCQAERRGGCVFDFYISFLFLW